MNDPIALLKKDHREAAALLDILAKSRPSARRRTTLTKLDHALRLHMQIEEGVVYPFVAQRLGREDAKEGTIEHGLIRDGLANLAMLVDEPGFHASVAMLTAGIRHHVREEERDMFPALKRALSREELASLGDDVVAAKKAGAAHRA